ncbi:MAG: hypothetical protein AAGH46_04280 [Bacteroidota bacterium]
MNKFNVITIEGNLSLAIALGLLSQGLNPSLITIKDIKASYQNIAVK